MTFSQPTMQQFS